MVLTINEINDKDNEIRVIIHDHTQHKDNIKGTMLAYGEDNINGLLTESTASRPTLGTPGVNPLGLAERTAAGLPRFTTILSTAS